MQDADFPTGRGKIRINAGVLRTSKDLALGFPAIRPRAQARTHNRRALQYGPLAAE